jgi:DNA topoisomerase-1
MRGPYGYYVQLGPTDPKAEVKPKRAAWPKNTPVITADLATALKLLALPRQLGNHPQTGKPVEANIGPFGPYIKHDGAYKSIPKSDSVYQIALERAVELLSAPKTTRGASGKQLGLHPQDQQPVVLLSGRYGPYVKHAGINATVGPDYDPANLTLEQSLAILAAKQVRPVKSNNSKARTSRGSDQRKARATPTRQDPKNQRPNTRAQGTRTSTRPSERAAAKRAASKPTARKGKS